MNLPRAALPVGGGQEFPPLRREEMQMSWRKQALFTAKGNKSKHCTGLLWRTQLTWKVWKCLELPPLRGKSKKNEMLLRVSEGLELETFGKVRTDLTGPKEARVRHTENVVRLLCPPLSWLGGRWQSRLLAEDFKVSCTFTIVVKFPSMCRVHPGLPLCLII